MTYRQSLVGLIFSRNTYSSLFVVFAIIIFFRSQILAIMPFLNDTTVYIAAIVIAIIYTIFDLFLKYKFRYLILENDHLIMKDGWYKKTNLVIPYAKIANISKKQNVIQMFFNNVDFKIETNDTLTNPNTLVFTMPIYEEIRNKVLAEKSIVDQKIVEQESNEETQQVQDKVDYYYQSVKPTTAQLIKYSLAKIKLGGFIGGLFVFFAVGFGIITALLGQERVDSSSYMVIIALAIITSLIYIGVTIGSTMIRVYNYEMIDHGDYFEVSFGLFEKKSYRIYKKYINGTTIHQSLIQKIFNISSIEVITTGFEVGEEMDANSFLMIVIDNKDIAQFMNLYLFEYADFKESYRPSLKNGLLSSTFQYLLIIAIGCLLLNIIQVNLLIYLVFIALVSVYFIACYTYFSHCDSIDFDDDKLYINNNTFGYILNMKSEKTVVKMERVLVVNYKSNQYTDIFNFGTVYINLFSDIIWNSNKYAVNYDKSIFNKLIKIVD